ncbi:MAG TPA: DUF6677 family protein [Blastocatellia bacterium]|nr:DUF6677 family protein [Blastocatellia bacterium]
MQTREELFQKGEARTPDSNPQLESYKPFPVPVRAGAVVAAWLVPGGGHLVLGRVGRGLLFLVLIAGSFFFGLYLKGRLYTPMVTDPGTSVSHFDLISALWSFAQVGSGLCYGVSRLFGFGTVAHYSAPTSEYGNTFMFLAGLLNYLVIIDAFDISAGRKR